MLRIPEELLVEAGSHGPAAALSAVFAWFEEATGFVADALGAYERHPTYDGGWHPRLWRDVLEGMPRPFGDVSRERGVALVGSRHLIEFLRLAPDDRNEGGTLAYAMDGTLVEGAAVPPSVYERWSERSIARLLEGIAAWEGPSAPGHGLEAGEAPVRHHEPHPVG